MKTLYLVRHAKAIQGFTNLSDIDRPLIERGYKEAHDISNRLALTGFKPELIVSSTGIRALTTALIFARNLQYPAGSVQLQEALYNATVEDLVDAVHAFDDSFENAMLFGHNPSITNASILMSDRYTEHIPTAGLVGIHFDVKHWQDISTRSGKLFIFDFPKNS